MGVPMETMAAAVCGLLCIIVFLGGASAAFVTHTVTLLYPLMATLKTLEGTSKWSRLSVEEWCVYWMMLCTTNASEHMFGPWITHWIPLYYPIKLLFCVGSLVPSTGILRTCLATVVPMLSTHVDALDASLDAAAKSKNE